MKAMGYSSLKVRISLLVITLLHLSSGMAICVDNAAIKETKESSTNDFVGRPLEAFNAVTTAGQAVNSSEFDGQVLIVSLWGLNCASCIEEMEALQQIYDQFHDRGLSIWAVNTENIGRRDINEGLKGKGIDISYDVLLDPGLRITKLFTSWFIPVTIIVDSKGIVQYYKIGYNKADANKIKAKVGALLAR